jgi:hypothetical protein
VRRSDKGAVGLDEFVVSGHDEAAGEGGGAGYGGGDLDGV